MNLFEGTSSGVSLWIHRVMNYPLKRKEDLNEWDNHKKYGILEFIFHSMPRRMLLSVEDKGIPKRALYDSSHNAPIPPILFLVTITNGSSLCCVPFSASLSSLESYCE